MNVYNNTTKLDDHDMLVTQLRHIIAWAFAFDLTGEYSEVDLALDVVHDRLPLLRGAALALESWQGGADPGRNTTKQTSRGGKIQCWFGV